MIRIEKKEDCCGCAACSQKCPKQCILMQEDAEGFLYPVITKEICIDCGLCEKVCPIINQGEKREPLTVYAAKNRDESIRRQSSSGGIFTLLAEQTLSLNGVVFGARFNDHWEVIHDYTETNEGLSVFRGSKYVQSVIGESYSQVEQFLKAGRQVLFSGTPCQIAGLKLFLRKEYDNLLSVDFICHGVPSPKVWKMYLDEVVACQNTFLPHSAKDRNSITSINFRDKSLGWKKYSFVLVLSKLQAEGEHKTLFSESVIDNRYLQGFIQNLYLRPACHSCPSKSLKSGSDLTIADYWLQEIYYPKFDKDTGVSLVLSNSQKGQASWFAIQSKTEYLISSLDIAIKGNPSLFDSSSLSSKRKKFWKLLRENNHVPSKVIISAMAVSFSSRVYNRILKIVSKK